jgi:hypothetical protein
MEMPVSRVAEEQRRALELVVERLGLGQPPGAAECGTGLWSSRRRWPRYVPRTRAPGPGPEPRGPALPAGDRAGGAGPPADLAPGVWPHAQRRG